MKKMLVFVIMSLFALTQAQTIGVSIPSATHGWTGGVNYWANQTEARLEAAYPGLDVIVTTAGSASEQANDLQDLVAINEIDALVILPFESDPLTAPVAEVKAQGVFITVVDRGLIDPTIHDIYVAGDNPGLGRNSAEFMMTKLSSGDNIVILRGIPTVIDNQRFDAFMETIDGSGINVLDNAFANWNRDDGFEVMQDFLSRFDDIDAVWAQDDDIAVGVLAALEQSGRDDVQFVLGGAGMKEMIKRVMDGDTMIPADVLYPPGMIATAIEITALKLVSDIPVLGEYILESALVTPENAADYYFPDSPF